MIAKKVETFAAKTNNRNWRKYDPQNLSNFLCNFFLCNDIEVGLVNLNSDSYKQQLLALNRILEDKNLLKNQQFSQVINVVNAIAQKKHNEIDYKQQRGAFTIEEVRELLNTLDQDDPVELRYAGYKCLFYGY